MKMKSFLSRYKHAWVLTYFVFYLVGFALLERHVQSGYHIIHSPLDRYIPFVEYFIIPYLLWFVYIAVTVGYFFFRDVKGFYKLFFVLSTGMTVFLVISALYPNGLMLRPYYFARDNIFVDMVRILYKIDTPTNVLPSIHVFNSLAAYFAISNSEELQQKRWVQVGSLVLTISIILSTMFLKQHSVVDVSIACIMAIIMYVLVYAKEPVKTPALSRQAI